MHAAAGECEATVRAVIDQGAGDIFLVDTANASALHPVTPGSSGGARGDSPGAGREDGRQAVYKADARGQMALMAVAQGGAWRGGPSAAGDECRGGGG